MCTILGVVDGGASISATWRARLGTVSMWSANCTQEVGTGAPGRDLGREARAEQPGESRKKPFWASCSGVLVSAMEKSRMNLGIEVSKAAHVGYITTKEERDHKLKSEEDIKAWRRSHGWSDDEGYTPLDVLVSSPGLSPGLDISDSALSAESESD